MKLVRLWSSLILAVSIGSTAWAQFGLYGAPALLPLPGVDTEAAPLDLSGVAPTAASVPVMTAPGAYPTAQGAGALPYDPAYPNRQSLALNGPKQKRSSPKPTPAQPGALGPGGGQPDSVSRMLQEGGCWPEPTGGGSQPCDSTQWCNPYDDSPWFGSVAALYMGRDEPNRLWTTFETNNNPNQLPTDAFTQWQVGGEVTFGRYFHCGLFGVAATYWTLDPLTGFSSQSVAGGSVSTPLIVSDIEFAGVNGTVLFDGAQEHRVWRRDEFHNVEVNLLSGRLAKGAAGRGPCAEDYGPTAYGGGSPWSADWLLGVRYFRFQEDFTFASLDQGYTWGQGGGLYQANLDDTTQNNLIGFQAGADLGYQLSPHWRLFATPKIGIYNNHVQHHFSLYRGDGTVANPTAASGVSGSYPVRSSEDVVSFLTEVNLGVDWQMTRRWSAFLGYRVLFATGIALADNQIPTYVVDIPEIADIDTNGQLVLHGAFAGVRFNY